MKYNKQLKKNSIKKEYLPLMIDCFEYCKIQLESLKRNSYLGICILIECWKRERKALVTWVDGKSIEDWFIANYRKYKETSSDDAYWFPGGEEGRLKRLNLVKKILKKLNKLNKKK